MAAGAVGLQTHIWNNNLKSLGLLIGFPILILALTYALLMAFGYAATVNMPEAGPGEPPQVIQNMALVGAVTWTLSPWIFGAVAIWFLTAFFLHQWMIDKAVKARPVTRQDEPRAYNLLENLCISRGMPVPALRVIETEGRNAYASGLRPKTASVTVTRGLLNTLNTTELEAVLAHELTHIRNRDVRLLVISIIFVGIIAFISEVVFRSTLRASAGRLGGARRGSAGNSGAIIVIALAIALLSYLFALLIRFAISRKREFMADAGAVDLTR